MQSLHADRSFGENLPEETSRPEQDDDDPSVITIDQKSIAAQVKALSTKKPHFIKTGTEDGEPTGSSFGGTKTPKKTNRSDELKAAYPSLN